MPPQDSLYPNDAASQVGYSTVSPRGPARMRIDHRALIKHQGPINVINRFDKNTPFLRLGELLFTAFIPDKR